MEEQDESQGAQRLLSMRRRAFALLCFVAGLLVCARVGGRSYPGMEWLAAFSEAALVGGLADWFAVVALFRHPLGLPIPHTAILRARQREISRTLGRFISENFLTKPVVAAQLSRPTEAHPRWYHRSKGSTSNNPLVRTGPQRAPSSGPYLPPDQG